MFTTIYKEEEISSISVPFYIITCDIIVQHHKIPVYNKALTLRLDRFRSPSKSVLFEESANLGNNLKILIKISKNYFLANDKAAKFLDAALHG